MSELDQFTRIIGEPSKVSDDDRGHVLEQIRSKRWDELGVLEHGGRLLFPEKIFARNPKTGKFEGTPVLLRVPRGDDLRKARIEARSIAKDEQLDEKEDAGLFSDLETLCILWLSIRETADPYGPFAMDPRDLEKRFDRPSLEQTNFRLTEYRRIIDPNVSGIPEDELAVVTAAIVTRQNLLPLAVYDSATQTRFVVTLATLHQVFLTARSSLGSPEPSTPEP